MQSQADLYLEPRFGPRDEPFVEIQRWQISASSKAGAMHQWSYHNTSLEHLNCWQSKSDLKLEALREIKEIGSVLYWMSLLDIVLEEAVQVQLSHHGVLGDSVAWGGCTIIYFLGQQLHFELCDFSHQVLNVAEVEVASVTPAHRNSHLLKV